MAVPQIFYKDPADVISETKALFESLLGKTLLPAQPEMQIVLAVANREVSLRASADYALSQMFVDASVAPALDGLASNAGITRLPALPAQTKILFTLVPGHGGVTIPSGTRVSTTDGKVLFATDYEENIPAGTNTATVDATATTDGPSGNGYSVGTVTEIVDVQPFLTAASNTTVTSAGADPETDDGLRVRIKLASSRYSTAGPVDAYKYFARSANQSIIDVAVLSPDPGVVAVYPLIAGGVETPEAILDAVFATLNSDTVRPLTDTVEVYSPDKLEYTLTVDIVLKYGAVQSSTVDAITLGLTVYANSKALSLGQDITTSQLTAAAMNNNVHSLSFPGFTDITVGPTEFPVCTGIFIGTVTYEDPLAT